MSIHYKVILGICLSLGAVVVCAGQSISVANLRQSAISLEQQGRNGEAETAWKKVLAAHPSHAEAFAHLGLLEARQEHYVEAVAYYRNALRLQPTMPGLKLNLGLALFKSGEMKQAIQIFKPMQKSTSANSPDAQRLNILLGMAHYGLNEYSSAVPYLQAAAKHDVQNLPLRLSLAHSCLWAKLYPCVLDTYKEILVLNSESAEADMLAGEALDAMKDHAGAILQFRAAAKANPQQPEVHFGLGYLLWTQRQYPEAEMELRAELANNPRHAQAMTYLADTKIQLNQSDAALPLLEAARQIAPTLSLARLDLGVLYADLGRSDEALAEMREAVRLNPEEANGHWHLGKLYRTLGKKEEAKAEFDRAASIHKNADEALRDKMKAPSVEAKSAVQ